MHVEPDKPRMIVRWDGYQWQPVTIVEDYTAAQRYLTPFRGQSPLLPLGPRFRTRPTATGSLLPGRTESGLLPMSLDRVSGSAGAGAGDGLRPRRRLSAWLTVCRQPFPRNCRTPRSRVLSRC